MATPLFGSETQGDSAQRMYNARATTYEDSWHPAFSQRFTALVPLRPGDRVLDLCCGTGLDAFLAAEAVGDDGEVVAVDITVGMLDVLHERQRREPDVGRRIRTIHHDVLDLEGLRDEGVAKASFDAVVCSCAFPLLLEPARALAHWRTFLKPGGVLAIDMPHQHNMRPGVVLEEVAKELGVKYPSNRTWFTSSDSLKELLESEGMLVETVEVLDNVQGRGSIYYSVEEADSRFEFCVNSSLTQHSASEDFKVKARSLFKEQWGRAAVNGKVEETDECYVFIARKPQ